MKKLSIIGIALSMVFILNACSQQTQAETTPTTVIETTEATTEAETTEATTISETTKAPMGKYGEYGEEAYNLLKLNWINWIYENEGDLRASAPTILGSISDENLEVIIQELLAIDRGTNPFQESQSASQSETQSASLAETTPAPEPTTAVEPTQSVPKTQVQETTPAPTQPTQAQPTESAPQNNSGTGAAISKEEEDAIWDAALGQDLSLEELEKKKDANPNGVGGIGEGNGDYDWQ